MLPASAHSTCTEMVKENSGTWRWCPCMDDGVVCGCLKSWKDLILSEDVLLGKNLCGLSRYYKG